ncbi:hypothetical protein BXY41_10955 [Lacrimispora xylanisolvens]|uniref:Uncharacterized protein n=1 Tax=Lacrimispora xylanisolvens TaxID=384636 RepID=A0A2S6HPT2_9FIRM|nr:hypothetical protein [Hungatella xylanolytica]PPK79577.1 hypothetical protein BXY41_10955 [Hungatella xylanolytica]
MKSNKKMFIIVPLLVLCLICASYVVTTKFITSNNNSAPAEESVSTTTKQEEVSTAPESTTGTPVNSTQETGDAETTGDASKIQDIISDQTTSVFDGAVGEQNIGMAIYRSGSELTASLFTANEEDPETKLLGTLNKDTSSFVLTSEDGSITFEGTLSPDTSNGDRLTGTFKNTKDQSETEFHLTLSHSVGSPLEGRYPLVNADAADVENFARQIKLNIVEDKKHEFADLINYPINVTINNKKISINSSEEFIQHYNDIVTSDFKNKLSDSYTKYLFSNSMGVMLGDGEIWFDKFHDQGFRIYAINN